MFALIAVILFVIGIFVLGTVHTWVFWALLGLVALSVHFLLEVPYVKTRTRARL